MRNIPIPAAIAAALSQKAHRREVGVPLQLPLPDDRYAPVRRPEPEDADDYAVTISVEDDDLL